jgi:hypothetical protein
MQTSVQKNDSVRLWSWVLKLNSVNIGLVEGVSMEVESTTAQIVAHNGQLPPRTKITGVKFKASMYEINMENLQTIFGGTQTTVNGTLQTVTAEAKGTGWVIWKPIRLNYKNGANTIVWSIVVKANAVALTLTTNYTTYVADGTNGDLGYTYIVPVTANALAITVDYTYTPFVSKKITYNDLIKLSSMYPLEFTNTDANWKVFSIKIYKAYSTNSLSLPFNGDNEIDKNIIIPLEFWAYADTSWNYFEINDEQDVA